MTTVGRPRGQRPVVIHALGLGPARNLCNLCDLRRQGIIPDDDPDHYAAELEEAAWRSVVGPVADG